MKDCSSVRCVPFIKYEVVNTLTLPKGWITKILKICGMLHTVSSQYQSYPGNMVVILINIFLPHIDHKVSREISCKHRQEYSRTEEQTVFSDL